MTLPVTVAVTVTNAVIELAKMGMQFYLSYMRQAGLTPEQIDQVYQQSRQGMLDRDPTKIPD